MGAGAGAELPAGQGLRLSQVFQEGLRWFQGGARNPRGRRVYTDPELTSGLVSTLRTRPGAGLTRQRPVGPGGSRISLPRLTPTSSPGKVKNRTKCPNTAGAPRRAEPPCGTLSTPVHSLEGGSRVFKSLENLFSFPRQHRARTPGTKTARAPLPSAVRARPPWRAQLSIWGIHVRLPAFGAIPFSPIEDIPTRAPVPRGSSPLSFFWRGSPSLFPVDLSILSAQDILPLPKPAPSSPALAGLSVGSSRGGKL